VFGYTGGLFDFNAKTGAVKWQYQDPTNTQVLSSPAILGRSPSAIVAAADLGGSIDVLSLADGSLLYRYTTGGYITASPAVSGGDLVLASSDSFLYDLAAGGGNETTLPSTAITSPADGSVLANPSGDVTITGTASDGTGVAGVKVAIQSGGPTGPWWNAASGTWNPGRSTTPPRWRRRALTTTNWSFSFPVAASGGTYSVTANAASTGGQSDIKGAAVSFSVKPSLSTTHVTERPRWIAPGANAAVTGGGFAPGETVSIALPGSILGTAKTDEDGGLPETSVAIPTSTLFGADDPVRHR
jgi:hypothetical protein